MQTEDHERGHQPSRWCISSALMPRGTTQCEHLCELSDTLLISRRARMLAADVAVAYPHPVTMSGQVHRSCLVLVLAIIIIMQNRFVFAHTQLPTTRALKLLQLCACSDIFVICMLSATNKLLHCTPIVHPCHTVPIYMHSCIALSTATDSAFNKIHATPAFRNVMLDFKS